MFLIFFEEFPAGNLEKAKLLPFPSIIFIAAKNFEEFQARKKELLKFNQKSEPGWWPILEKSYWVSPFSETEELKNLLGEIEDYEGKESLKLLLDLELPFLNPRLFFKNFWRFRRNKRIIEKIFLAAPAHNIEIFSFEYLPLMFFGFFLSLFGLSYNIQKYPQKKIISYYSSMLRPGFLKKIAKNKLKKLAKSFGDKLIIGLGVIARGLFNEPLLSPEELEKDLEFLKNLGIKTAAIYRLGGLDEKYLEVFKKYLN